MRALCTVPAFLALFIPLLSLFVTGAAGRIVTNEHHQLARIKRDILARAELVQRPVCTDPTTVRTISISVQTTFCADDMPPFSLFFSSFLSDLVVIETQLARL
jgi:hypothetical protein